MRRSHSTALIAASTLMFLAGPIPAQTLAQRREMPKSFTAGLRDLSAIKVEPMPVIDTEALREEDSRVEANQESPGPYRFAAPIPVALNPGNSGRVEALPDGSLLWRVRIRSAGAETLNLGFGRFDVAATARLWIYEETGEYTQGPFTAADRTNEGRLWTPIVPGDEIVVELHAPAGPLDAMVEVGFVNHGYRGFGGADKVGGNKNHGACNIDVICSAGNPWRDQIRSVARYTISGVSLCTGQLVNNTDQDFTPYFLSAFHCDVDSTNDSTLVFYWNYEAPDCGDQCCGSLTDNQTGATYRAGWADSDFVLVELDDDPDPALNVYFTGWDASGATPGSAVGIHHPRGDVKSICFENNGLTTTAYLSDTPDASENHWRIGAWDAGTTEGGSSGSCLWDPNTGLCVGQLHGGYALCSATDESDWYGKLSVSWEGGGSAATRLRDWLNPANDGTTSVGGAEPPIAGGPVMRLLEATLDFGSVELGFAFTKAIAIYNDGDAPLVVSVANTNVADPHLSQWSDLNTVTNETVAVGTDPLIVQQTYEPQAVGFHDLLFEVTSNDSGNPSQTVPFTGSGITPIPIDGVLVLDRSGSMDETAGERRKINAMQDAADLFSHLLRPDVGGMGTGDQLGFVKYNATNSVYLALDFVTPAHLLDAEDKLSDAAIADASRLLPTGATGIGGAMQTAAGLFTVPAVGRKHVMVVLTDGIENRTPWIGDVIGPIQAGDADLLMYSVGVGSNIEPNKLQDITNVGNGYHQVSDDLSGTSLFELETFYFKIFANATGMDLVVDPTIAVHLVGSLPIVVDSARITSPDRHATFLALDNPDLRKLYELQLKAPNGQILGLGSTVAGVGVQYVQRGTYTFFRVLLPDASTTTEYLGDWVLQLLPRGIYDPEEIKALAQRTDSPLGLARHNPASAVVPIGFAAAVGSNYRMSVAVLASSYLPGASVLLTATLTDQGWPSAQGRLLVDVTGPGGTVLRSVTLNDAGLDGDVASGDGTWSGRFVDTGATGTYRFVFRGVGTTSIGELAPREASRFLTLMRPSRDPGAQAPEGCIPCWLLWVFLILVVVLLLMIFLRLRRR